MATYNYQARDKQGKLVKGVMGAESEFAVATKLKELECLPIEIHLKKERFQNINIVDNFKRIRFAELNTFTRQLYTLLNAGLPLLRGLNTLKEQTVNAGFRDIVGKISRDIEAGSTLSESLAKHPNAFNALYVNMVKSGEVSGRLPEALERLATLGEHDEKVRLKVKAAMRYPLIVLAAIIIGFITLIVVVIPRFTSLYAKFNTELPMPTRILLMVNHIFTHYWWLLVILAAASTFLFKRLLNTTEGMAWLDSFKLKIPVFGPLLLNLTMTRFCRISGTLIQSGIPILQILDLVGESVGNTVVSRAISNIKTSVNSGKGMFEPMKQSGLFPPMVIQMVAVGEETGKLDELLIHVSDYYDNQIDYMVSNLVTLIEPMLTVVLGGAVLLMALGIFLPLWNMMNLFKK